MLPVLPAVINDRAVGQNTDIAYPVEPLTNREPAATVWLAPAPLVLENDNMLSCFFLDVVLRMVLFDIGRFRV